MIHLAFPWVPPSLNNAYENNRGGGRRLSEEARWFKTETPPYLLQHHRTELLFFKDKKDVRLTAAACVTFTSLENEGWGVGRGKKKPAARYKKRDATNRIKFLEDALVVAAGSIDDSQFFPFAIQQKAGKDERTDIWVWDPGKEDSYLDEFFELLLLGT